MHDEALNELLVSLLQIHIALLVTCTVGCFASLFMPQKNMLRQFQVAWFSTYTSMMVCVLTISVVLFSLDLILPIVEFTLAILFTLFCMLFFFSEVKRRKIL